MSYFGNRLTEMNINFCVHMVVFISKKFYLMMQLCLTNTMTGLDPMRIILSLMVF